MRVNEIAPNGHHLKELGARRGRVVSVGGGRVLLAEMRLRRELANNVTAF